jgi:hypothetical protein
LIKLFPQLDDDLLLRLFHKGIKAQWSAADVDWEERLALDERQARALCRLLTPVYLGEQSAMVGASVALPQIALAGETTAQLYLSSFLMDEARHFEALTRLYQRLREEPIPIRDMPEMLRYHNRLRKGDRVDWVWGILISDIFARNFYQIFSRSQPEALFGRLSTRILQDESRHQAFATHYLERVLPTLPRERVQALARMRDELLEIMDHMYHRLTVDAEILGIDGRRFLDELREDIEAKADRIGLNARLRPGNGASGGAGEAGAGVETAAGVSGERGTGDDRHGFRALVARRRCDDCFVSLLCRSRLVTAATLG